MSSRSFLGNLRRPEASLAQVLQYSTHMETNAKKGLRDEQSRQQPQRQKSSGKSIGSFDTGEDLGRQSSYNGFNR